MSFEASVLIVFVGFPVALYLLWYIAGIIENIALGVYLSPHHKTFKDKFWELWERVWG